jgi:hypothetical protein
MKCSLSIKRIAKFNVWKFEASKYCSLRSIHKYATSRYLKIMNRDLKYDVYTYWAQRTIYWMNIMNKMIKCWQWIDFLYVYPVISGNKDNWSIILLNSGAHFKGTRVKFWFLGLIFSYPDLIQRWLIVSRGSLVASTEIAFPPISLLYKFTEGI